MQATHSRHIIKNVMHRDIMALPEDYLVCQALEYIRTTPNKPRILYFYVVDQEQRLKGVVSARILLTADLNDSLGKIANHKVQSISQEANLEDTLNNFMTHRYLAIPVVDEDKRLVGVVDVSSYADNFSEMMEQNKADEVFETIGYRLSQIKGASPFKAFRYRFPWLIASIAGGLMCAVMTSRFENVLAAALVLSFFLTLVLGLGESVSMQSMTVTIQALRSKPPSLKWFLKEISREFGTALLLGLACGIVVGGTVFLWQKQLPAALVIGSSLVLTLITANLVGLIIPTVLHALHLDPKIASGPLALTISDLFTIFIYFGMAGMVLS